VKAVVETYRCQAVVAHAKVLAAKRGVKWESLEYFGANRDGVSGHRPDQLACFRCVKETRLAFVECIGTRRVDQRSPQ